MDWAITINNPMMVLMCQAETENEARQMTLAAYPGCIIHTCILSMVKCKRTEIHTPALDEYGENQELHNPPQSY